VIILYAGLNLQQHADLVKHQQALLA